MAIFSELTKTLLAKVNQGTKGLLKFFEEKIHFIYFILALSIGLFFVFAVPPFQVPDENAHYLRSAGLTEGTLLCQNDTFKIEEEKIDLIDTMNVSGIAFQANSKFNRNLINNYKDSGDHNKKAIDPIVCNTLPFGHTVSALGVGVGNLLGLNELSSFYLGRIFNLLAAITIVSLSIRIIPFGKKLVFILGLLPISLFLFASFNYDAIFIPFLLLWNSLILKFYAEKKLLNAKQWIILGLVAFIISTIKLGYQPLLLLLLIFVNKPYSRSFWRALIKIITIWIISVAPIIGVLGIIKSAPLSNTFSPQDQIDFIIHNPFSYLIIFFKSLYITLPTNIRTFIGVLGWLDYKISTPSMILIIILIGLVIIDLSPKVRINRFLRILLITSCSLITVFIFTSMYIFSTPVGTPYVTGIQGRYFIGIFPTLIIGFIGIDYKKLFYKYKHLLPILILLITGIAILDAIISTVLRYY
ncbi:DUF2142 domain-containing protein [Candidatus Dojkabacteria bacterium]|nr:DUF2142 domain-containing protein [Candidatus Dojkabacteria bacterium]